MSSIIIDMGFTALMILVHYISLIWSIHIYKVHGDDTNECTIRAFYVISIIIQFIFGLAALRNLYAIISDYIRHRTAYVSSRYFMIYVNLNLVPNMIMNVFNIYFYNTYSDYTSRDEYLYIVQISLTFAMLFGPVILVLLFYTIILEIDIRKHKKEANKLIRYSKDVESLEELGEHPYVKLTKQKTVKGKLMKISEV